MKVTGCRRQLFFRGLIVTLLGVPALAVLVAAVWGLSLTPGGRSLMVGVSTFIVMLVGVVCLVAVSVGGYRLGGVLARLSGWKDSYYLVRVLSGVSCLGTFTVAVSAAAPVVTSVWGAVNAWPGAAS